MRWCKESRARDTLKYAGKALILIRYKKSQAGKSSEGEKASSRAVLTFAKAVAV
jgi:hypothetical protein